MTWWVIFEIAINLFQASLIVYFLRKQMRTVRKSFMPDAYCILAIAGLLTLYLFFDIPAADTIIFILPLIYGFLVFDARWYIVVFWVMVIALIFTGVANLTSSFYFDVLGVDWDELMNEDFLRLTFVLSSNMLMLILVLIVTKLRSRSGELPWHSFVLLLALNFLCLTVTELLFSMGINQSTDRRFMYASLFLFIISLLSIVLYEVLVDNANKQQRYKLEIERLAMLQKHNQEMQSVYDDLATFRHDIKHQIQVIAQMVAGHDTTAVKGYIDALSDQVNALQPFMTGNIAVDALLTAKTSTMRRRQIDFAFSPYPLSHLPFDESKFCALLGNLLDNAIEGIERLPDAGNACISLSFARTWDMFYIVCKNRCNPSTIQRKNDLFLSSKSGMAHGIGTRSIEAIVRRANGRVHFDVSDDIFRVEIVLPYEAEGQYEKIC